MPKPPASAGCSAVNARPDLTWLKCIAITVKIGQTVAWMQSAILIKESMTTRKAIQRTICVFLLWY